jgi:glucan phosphoethanolaminetransferase (alkaline phosphatase superfamily)
MKEASQGGGKRATFFALLAVLSLFTCFILAPLGSFIRWIFGGIAVYSLFLAVYSLLPRQRKEFGRTRHDPRQEEMKTYIAFHTSVLLGLFGITLFAVLVLLFVL